MELPDHVPRTSIVRYARQRSAPFNICRLSNAQNLLNHYTTFYTSHYFTSKAQTAIFQSTQFMVFTPISGLSIQHIHIPHIQLCSPYPIQSLPSHSMSRNANQAADVFTLSPKKCRPIKMLEEEEKTRRYEQDKTCGESAVYCKKPYTVFERKAKSGHSKERW